MTEFETKDSGQHEQYESGMRRDSNAGKPRFDLIRTKLQPYEEQMITRYAKLLARGAAKYDPRNWEDGDSEVELERAQDSLLRHVEQLIAGEDDEDHAAAVWFNTQAIEYFKWRIAQKKKQATMSVSFDFDASAAGQHLVELITGGVITTLRGNLKPSGTKADYQSSGDPELWKDVGRLEQAPVLPKFPQSDEADDEDDFTIAKRKFQDSINEWHNRPITERLAPPDPAVLASDGTKDGPVVVVSGSMQGLQVPEGTKVVDNRKMRLDDWMQEYGDDIKDFDGFPGLDTYALITRAEYLAGLPLCTMNYNFSRHAALDGEGC